MSQRTFEDFLRWKKEQQTGGRRHNDDSSSDTDSSVEEVKYAKRSVNNIKKKKYYEESDTSSSSDVEEYPSRRRKGERERDRGERDRGDRRYNSERKGDRERERERDRGDSERDRRYNSERNGKSREVKRDRSRNGRSSRRFNRDSSDEEEIVIVNRGDTRKIQLKGNKVTRTKSSRRDRDDSSDDSSSESDDRRYRRNVDSSDSEENRHRRKKPITTSKSSKSRRSKSEHIQKKAINKKRVDSSEEDHPPHPRHSVRASRTPTVTKGRKAPPKKTREVDSDTSSEEVRKPVKKEVSPKKSTKSRQTPTEQPHREKLKIQKKDVSTDSSSDEDNKPKKPTISTKNKATTEKHSNSDIHFEYNHWLENWEKIFNNEDKDAKKKRSQLKELLQQIDHMTDRVCNGSNFVVSERNGQDINEKSYNLKTFDLASSIKKTQLYAYHHVEKHMPQEGVKGPTKTTAHFIKSDIIDVGLFIKKEIRKNPLVLMMGDPRTPGGEDHRCLFGEEIAIWRRTAIREFLEDNRREKYFSKGEKDTFAYDIPQNGAVYCPDVPVFRSKQTKGYSFTTPETLSFVIVPPIMNPHLEGGRLRPEDVEIVKKKIDMIFLVALANNHDAVVVTAFGCGYAQNPPQHIAEILTESIAKFKNHFSNIAFAIIDNANARKNSPEGNITPFSNVFSTLLKKHSNENK